MISNDSLDNNNINKTNQKISKYCPDISLINSQLDSDTGNTPLILSILSQDIKSFLELLSLGANPNITNYSGETPLHISISKGFNDYIILLLKYDVNPNIKNYLGQTAMHLALINKLDENILQRLKEKNGDIYNIKDNFNKTAFDYAKEKEKEDKNYINILIKIFGKKKEKNKFGQTWNEKKLSDIINEIKNSSQSYNYNNNYKKINDKYYLDTLLNNHSERNKTKYEQNDIYENSKINRLNSEINKKEIKLDDFTEAIKEKENKEEEKKKSINKKYTHGRAMLCGDLNSNNIQIKELNNSSDIETEKSKKSLSDFLAEEINNLDINNYKSNLDIVDINNNTDNNNKNINVSRIYSQKSESSALSKIIEDKENSNLNSNMNSNIPFSHSSSRINTYKSDKSNLSNKQSLYQSNSLNNKNIIKKIINDTVKKIEVKSITSSEGDNLSNLNILSKDSEKNISKKNNEFNINSNTNNDNYNLYENGTTSIVMYKNKNSDEINNKDNKNINISNIDEEINIITYTNKTDKTNKTNNTNKTNEFIQDNNINRNKTIILSNLNYPNSTKNIQESSTNIKNNEIKDNIFLNSENSHIFSDLNTYTNNYNNVSLSYSKNIQSEELNKTNTKNKSNDKKNELNIKSINNSNNSLHGSNYSNNTKRKRVSNGNPNSSTGIKKSKSFVDSTSMKKSNFNKSIYNKLELENLNLKNNENIESNDKGNKIGNNSNNNFINDKIYKKHHRQLSYHINYKSGINNNKEKEFKRNNTKDIISNFNILRTSNKKDQIYQNKNNIAYYSNTKSNNSENKTKNDNINSNKKNKNTNKDSLIGINKSIKSLTSTNNPNITVTHNIFANSITNTNNNNNKNDSNLNIDNIKNKTKKNNTNKIISGNNSNNNTDFSTLNKQNRLSKFSSNNNVNNIPKQNQKIYNFNDDIIYNDDDDYEDENDLNCDIRNINTDILLRLREFLLSCDLLCYFNLMIEKKVYKIDSYINNIQEGITPLTYEKLENIGIKKPGHIFRILIKLDIDAGIIDNNLFNFIIEKINYRAYTTTTLAMTSSITDVNCCGINICSNNTKFGNRKSGRNPTFNFSDLSSFLRLYNLTKFKGNFIFNGFDKIEFILIQMFSKYIFDQKILTNYLHIYINKDKIKLLNKLYTIKSSIAKEFGIEVDYNEYNKIMDNKMKRKLINISNISNEKKSIRRNMSYIQNINNTYFNETNSIKNSINNDENTDISNQSNENNCNIF